MAFNDRRPSSGVSPRPDTVASIIFGDTELQSTQSGELPEQFSDSKIKPSARARFMDSEKMREILCLDEVRQDSSELKANENLSQIAIEGRKNEENAIPAPLKTAVKNPITGQINYY